MGGTEARGFIARLARNYRWPRDDEFQCGPAVSPEVMQRFFALLTLVALAIVAMRVFTAIAVRTPLQRSVRQWISTAAPAAIPAAFAIAATTMLGSLYFSEVAHYTPCKLCWFQRICLYPIALILGYGLARRDPSVRGPAVLLAVVVLPISAYHYLIEWYPTLESGTCDPNAPCTALWFRQFGFVSLPLMAAAAALAIISLLSLRSTTP